ncbi:DUF3034 family protein [Polaromonas sp.]|uniref:DUF3034 family protein n=1 Tax=Polaromonas sp. TaxID=1869339 RepID=UPI00356436A0
MTTPFAPRLVAACIATLCAGAGFSAHAETGKLLLTGGVSSIDGAAGGGLTPWAVIGSNATEGETGGTAFVTTARTKDYGLNIVGASVGINDRYELSIAQQDLKTGVTGTGLGLPGLHLKQTILGAKIRVAGDAVLDADTLMPQVAVGVEYKTLGSTGLDGTLRALGAKREGVDVYVSATKLFLGQSLLVNGTLRATKANQNGLLGYGATLGGGSNNSYSLQPEFSVAYLISKNVAVGAEYRFMRNKLETAGRAAGLGNGLRSEDWKDVFIAWAPNKNVSVTLAYVDLGVIVPATTASRKQTGYCLSAQVAF